jgi:parallel beta-helix repeat protein
MSKNALFKKGIVITIIVLFIGMSILPTTGGILLEESLELTFYGNEGKTPPSSIDTLMEYHERLLHSHILGYESIFYSKEGESKLQREHSRCEVTGASLEEVVWTDICNKGEYTPHDPIYIEGNDGFTEENGVTGGNGTADDPYIIKGWEITGAYGIYISDTAAYFIVRHCLLRTEEGIHFFNVSHGTVMDVISEKGYIAFGISESSYVAIQNSTMKAQLAVSIIDSSYVSVSNCSINVTYLSLSGVYIENSMFIHLSDITIHSEEDDVTVGIMIVDSPHNVIEGCEVWNFNYGVEIVGSPDQTLRNNQFHDNNYNLWISPLDASDLSLDDFYHTIDDSNTINGKPILYMVNEGNLTFDGDEEIGFLGLVDCFNITVTNVTLHGNGMGVLLAGTEYSTIISSTYTENFYGVFLWGSPHNVIRGCQCERIFIFSSPNNVLRDNTFDDAVFDVWYNFGVYGVKPEDFCLDIDTSNTVNGKPVYYLVGEKDQVLQKNNIGYLGLVNCVNIKIKGAKISDTVQGILLVNTSATLQDCTLQGNLYGIYVYNSSGSTIVDSKLRLNEFGLNFEYASNNTVVDCDISLNMAAGFNMNNSYGNVIKRCKVIGNSFNGFQISNCWNNRFSFNTISLNVWGGINMDYSWGNEICFNTIKEGTTGIILCFSSQGNEIHHNSIHHNEFTGVHLQFSDNNSIHHNTIHHHRRFFGMGFFYSHGNQVDHNNFYDNEVGVMVAKCMVDLRENWWGSRDGPGGYGPGSGDTIEVNHATIYYEPWLKHRVFVLLHGLSYIVQSIFGMINCGGTHTILDGNEVDFDDTIVWKFL